MKKYINLTILSFISLFFVACGWQYRDDGYRNYPPPQNNYYPCQNGQYPCQYNQSEGNCTTGTQVFQSREQYCQGLRNDTLNNRCATNWRYESFRNNCSDQNWQNGGWQNGNNGNGSQNPPPPAW
ncbi:MAG: hypothetical protein AB7O96_04690 [Pseudobdellovibrionaceae bacterium]